MYNIDLMWKEVTEHFPKAVFISYHSMSPGKVARLKFLPRDSLDLDSYITLIYDGSRYTYLIGLDQLIKWMEENNNV